MRDEAGGDDKVLCVPVGDHRQTWRQELTDVSDFHRLEVQHFFEVYKDLEPGKSVEGAHWVSRDEAEAEITASFARAKGTPFEHMNPLVPPARTRLDARPQRLRAPGVRDQVVDAPERVVGAHQLS